MPVESGAVHVGAQAPDFELESIAGPRIGLSQFRGRPVVLVFLRGFG